jgi:hypothetical protein
VDGAFLEIWALRCDYNRRKLPFRANIDTRLLPPLLAESERVGIASRVAFFCTVERTGKERELIEVRPGAVRDVGEGRAMNDIVERLRATI